MKAIVSISSMGNKLAETIKKNMPDCTCYTLSKWSEDDFLPIQGSLKDFCGSLFQNYDAIIFIMATGIVVRSIAPWLKDKTTDPAVVVMDNAAKSVISLLCGHIGGANQLANEVAKIFNAHPVITTSSDVHQLPSVDMMALDEGLHIDSMRDAKNITAKIVNKQLVDIIDEYGFFNDFKMPQAEGELNGRIIVTNKYSIESEVPFVKLIPENIILGIGCRKNTSSDELWKFIEEVFCKKNLDLRSIKAICSINIKAAEPAILKAIEKLQCQSHFYKAKELEEVDHLFIGSDFVRAAIGVGSVSTTSAYLGGNKKGRFLVKKAAREGMTISVFENGINS